MSSACSSATLGIGTAAMPSSTAPQPTAPSPIDPPAATPALRKSRRSMERRWYDRPGRSAMNQQGAKEYSFLVGFEGDWRDTWWNADFLDLMARRWGLSSALRVLDVGCGVGHWGR